MMMLRFVLVFVCAISVVVGAPWTEVEDQSGLPFLSSDLKTRKTGKITLPNGMDVLLISDTAADQSAAVVVVEAGSWNDPTQYPGMAHFCEHMLFLGTAKYPDPNEFTAEVSNFDGKTNAWTSSDQTVYLFSCHTPGFLPLLDRFAHFFIDPLFNPSNIARELHAVDQEFSMQLENDGWREFMVFKETSNPDHPNHLFTIGNSQTLAGIPQSALKEWHKAHYGANRMHAAIYSSLPMETLKQEAAKALSAVPRVAYREKILPSNMLSAEQKGHLTSIEPIRRRQSLSLTWELPSHLVADETKSADFAAYLLQRGHEYSLQQKLKTMHLIDDLQVRLNRQLSRNTALFEIEAELSDQGMKNIDSVIATIFRAIQGLKGSDIPAALFQEKNTLAKLNYQYQNRIDAFDYVSTLGRTLAQENLATYPRKTLLGTEYNPKNVQETLQILTPEQCFFSLLAPQESTKVQYDKKEAWFSVPYTIRSLPLDWMISWRQSQFDPEIRIALLNPFTPQNLKTLPDPGFGVNPVCIAESNFGKAFYARMSEYQNPEGAVHLHIFSPEIAETPKSAVLSALYLDHLTDRLHPLLLAASSAQLSCDFAIEKNHLHITLTGFSEKLPLLLQSIIQAMPAHPPTLEEFQLYMARSEKGYANSMKALPVRQGMELLSSVVNPCRFTGQEQLKALKTITFEDFTLFHKKLFEKTYFQALFAGNLSVKDAESSWLDVLHVLGKSPYPQGDLPIPRALQLPDDEGPFLIAESTEAQGNAAILLIDEGNFSLQKKAVQKVLSAALHEPFFDTLRTKQKTGYIANSSSLECEKRLYQYFLVQSNSHQPEDLLHRFELFLEEFRQDFATFVSNERFETLKKSQIESLKTESRNITEKAELFDTLAFIEKGDFEFVQKQIRALEALSYETFAKMSDELLARKNRKRLAILYTGQTREPFAYLPMKASDLPQVATYAPRPTDELDSAVK